MERDVMDLIKEKEFIELTGTERSEVNELCANEEEFNQMKAMLASIGGLNWSNPTPKPETKERLDLLFQQNFPKAAPVWYNSALAVVVPKDKPIYRQPLIQLAAVGLLFLMVYPFLNNSVEANEQLAVVEKTDAPAKEKTIKKVQKTSVQQGTGTTNKSQMMVLPSESASSVEDVFSASEPIAMAPPPPVSAVRSATVDLTSTLAGANPASATGSDHPDGIFRADLAEVFSAPASRQPEVFDLLTTSF